MPNPMPARKGHEKIWKVVANPQSAPSRTKTWWMAQENILTVMQKVRSPPRTFTDWWNNSRTSLSIASWMKGKHNHLKLKRLWKRLRKGQTVSHRYIHKIIKGIVRDVYGDVLMVLGELIQLILGWKWEHVANHRPHTHNQPFHPNQMFQGGPMVYGGGGREYTYKISTFECFSLDRNDR